MEVPPNEDSEHPVNSSIDTVHPQQDNVLPDTVNDGYIRTSLLVFAVMFILGVMMVGCNLVILILVVASPTVCRIVVSLLVKIQLRL